MSFRHLFSRFVRLSAAVPLFQARYAKPAVVLASALGPIFAFYKCYKPRLAFAQESVSGTDQKIIEEADKLYNRNVHPRKLYEHLKQYQDSNNSEILWRLSRAARDLALKTPDISSSEKKALVYEAFETSKKALEINENSYAPHKWYAITIGDVGDYEGTKVKISNAFIIRDHLERAAQLNPNDATTLHCIGMWCFVFADMPRWQHMIAGVVFATPPSSTYKEAAEYFMQAERVDPNFYSVNLVMLGKTYMKMGDVKRAMLFLDRAIHYPVVTTEDEEAKNDAEVLMKQLLGKK